MAWAKRIILFLAVNFLVILTVSLILNIFNIRPYITSYGLDYRSLLIFCLIWGMAGAMISLALSRIMAKMLMGVKVIDPDRAMGEDRELLKMVYDLSRKAGLPNMPEVGVYNSPEVNAFATGPTKSRALVAVSSGLLNRMQSDEVEGVLAHEVTHISNGDMVTMTLVQGVINAFVMFFARIVAFALTRRDDKSGEVSSYFLYNVIVFVLEIVFMILGSIVIAAYSRYREFRADAGGARLAGRDKMIGALQALKKCVDIKDPRAEQSSFQAFKIADGKGILRFFASHPPLDERIARLKSGR